MIMVDRDQQQNSARLSRLFGQRKRTGPLAPRFRFGFHLPDNTSSGFMQLLPFRRHWPAILIILALASVMSIPLFSLNLNAGRIHDMFDLTSLLFNLFWGLGWSAGILIMVCLVLLLLFARERIIVEPA